MNGMCGVWRWLDHEEGLPPHAFSERSAGQRQAGRSRSRIPYPATNIFFFALLFLIVLIDYLMATRINAIPNHTKPSGRNFTAPRPERMKINHEEHEDFFYSLFAIFVSSWLFLRRKPKPL
jgi:hypothetical protein